VLGLEGVWVHVVGRGEPPAGRFADEAVVAEVVVAVSDQDVEDGAAEELLQVFGDVTLGAVVRGRSGWSRTCGGARSKTPIAIQER
jgi:hypothetical protein